MQCVRVCVRAAHGCMLVIISIQVMKHEVPFVGAYMNGELGPHIRNGYSGWAMTPSVLYALRNEGPAGSGSQGQQPAGVLNQESGDGAHAGVVGSVAVGGRVLPLTASQLQGYTSMYAVIG